MPTWNKNDALSEQQRKLLADAQEKDGSILPENAQEGQGRAGEGKLAETPKARYETRSGKAQLWIQPYSAKSLNHFKNNWQRKQEREHFYALILGAVKRKLTPPDHKQRVTITRILGKGERRFDAANEALTGGTGKQLIDAMKLIGFWHDDNERWLERDYKQDSTKRHLGPAVLVEIEVV